MLYVQYINNNKHLKLLNFLWFCGGSSRAIDSYSSKEENPYLYGTQRFITIFLKVITVYLHAFIQTELFQTCKNVALSLLCFCIHTLCIALHVYLFYVNCQIRHVCINYKILQEGMQLFIFLDVICNEGYHFIYIANVCFIINCTELMKLIIY